MNKNVEMMKKLLEKKKKDNNIKQSKKKIPDRYGKQSAGAGNL